MLENIKRIGLFMIVAQTFIQFAAGKQYEKYMKIISGVIVLLMFVSPFASSQENLVEQWEEQVGRMTEKIENSVTMHQGITLDTDYGLADRTIQQLEEEIKSKLNNEMQGDEYKISDVMIEWSNGGAGKSGAEQEMSVKGIKVILQQPGQSGNGEVEDAAPETVVIEEIRIGMNTERAQDGQSADERVEYDEKQEKENRDYRNFFAEILGIDADKVEVVYGG